MRAFREISVPLVILMSHRGHLVVTLLVVLQSLGTGHVLSQDLDEIIRRHIKEPGEDRTATAQLTVELSSDERSKALEIAESMSNEAFRLAEERNLQGAVVITRWVLAIHEEIYGVDHPDTIMTLNNLGALLLGRDDRTGAKYYLKRAFLISKKILGPDHPSTAALLTNLQTLNHSHSLTNQEKQDQLLIEVAELDSGVARLLQAGHPKYSAILAERALRIRKSILGLNNPETATSLNIMGFVIQELGDYTLAESYFERALKIQEIALGPSHPDTATSLNNLGYVLQMTGQFKNAISRLERALEIRERVLSPTDHHIAITLGNLGDIYQQKGEMAKARLYFERSLSIIEMALGPNHPETANSVNNLGILLQVMGDFNGAKQYLERALRILESASGANHPKTALALINLGDLLQTLGGLQDAKPYFERALRIQRQILGPEHPQTALSFIRLGEIQAELGDLKGAYSFLDRALKIREKVLGPEHPNTASSYDYLGNLVRKMGHPAIAQPFYEHSLAIRSKVFGPAHPDMAISLTNLGSVREDMGDLESARGYYEGALAIHEEVFGLKHPRTAVSLSNLGILFRRMNNLKKAQDYLERALAINEKIFGTEHLVTATDLSNLGSLLEFTGDINRAIILLARSLDIREISFAAIIAIGSEQERQMFFQSNVGPDYYAISFRLRAAPNDARAARMALNSILRRKGRILDAAVSGLRLIRSHMSVEDNKLLQMLTKLREARAYLLLHSFASHSSSDYERLQQLDLDIQRITGKLASRSAVLRQKLTPISLEAVQARIPERGSLVEFFVYEPFVDKATDNKRGKREYVVYVLRRSGDPKWIKLGDAEAIDAAADAFRQAVARRQHDVHQLARGLDVLTMEKVRPLLGDSDWLVLSPDGELNLIPFAALLDETGRYLIERYGLSYVTSGRDLLRFGTKIPSQEQPLILGDPDFNASPRFDDSRGKGKRSGEIGALRFQRLPATAKEAQAIARVLQVSEDRILTGDAATEAAIKKLHGPRMLHLATHGFFLPDLPNEHPWDTPTTRNWLSADLDDPLLRSGLALSGFNRWHEAQGANDGMLTALEVTDLDLWGTEVVVLSACETGVGDVRVEPRSLRPASSSGSSRSENTSHELVADSRRTDQRVDGFMVRATPDGCSASRGHAPTATRGPAR